MNGKYEKNIPYISFREENANDLGDRWEILKDKTRTLWSGRYCAVAGFVYAIVNGEYCILAGRRGPEAPDFKGYWNCPCGFLEGNEDGVSGIIREIYEETGIRVLPEKLKFLDVETSPEKCNNGNVTLRYICFLGVLTKNSSKPKEEDASFRGGEIGEVDIVSWIPLRLVSSYIWAFGHKELIIKYSEKRPWKLWLMKKGLLE